MSSKNTKNLLKEAREAVKNKNYQSAIETCKEVLKVDENNYMALILLGAAYQDNNKIEAVKYLKLALKNTTDPTIALQGLSHCVTFDELPEICEKLLKLTPNKYLELHEKILNTATSLINLQKCLEILSTEINPDYDEKRRSSALECLAQIFVAEENRIITAKGSALNANNNNNSFINNYENDEWNEIMEMSLEHSIQNLMISNHMKMMRLYIKILYKMKKFYKIVEMSSDMSEHYPNDVFPLEWICKIFIENYNNDNFDIKSHINYDLHSYFDKLLKINENSTIALMAYGLYYYIEENYVQARDFLIEVNRLKPDCELCLQLLAEIYIKLRGYYLAEFFYNQLKNDKNNINYLECLVEQKTKEKLNETINLCKILLPNADDHDQLEYFGILTKALIYSQQYEMARKSIEKLDSLNENINKINYLTALNFYYDENNVNAMDNLKRAVEILQSIKLYNLLDYYLLLGQIYIKLQMYADALNEFMIATKMQPYNSDCFYWLGRIYLINTDQIRARKCFEKCVKLNPLNENAVTLLSSLYRQNSEWQANENLLQLTVNTLPGITANKWAWLQLGYHHLAKNSYDDAIIAFRSALRDDENDINSWEGLGDAYVQRGSFTSAMNIYDKIATIDPTNYYSKLQVANIKVLLKLYKEAIGCYELLLIECPKYLPALKGLSEAHLGRAHYLLSQRLIGRSKVHMEYSVKYVLEAIQLRSNVSCLWRLLANILDSIAFLPLSKAFIMLPGSLIDGTAANDEYKILNGEDIFELAARCYCRSIKINNNIDTSLIWYELALSYYLHYMKYCIKDNIVQTIATDDTQQHQKSTKSEKYSRLSYETIKYAIKLCPTRWQNWNLLGIICTKIEINNLPLAQHCFIKSLNIDKKSAVAWSNLGAFYLSQGNNILANKAFSRAQQSDTTLINAWIGQAIIAEQMNYRFEAMDLFRHTTSLEYSPESAIGYTHWVCKIIADKSTMADKHFRYAIENLYGIPLALDSIGWFCVDSDVLATKEGLCFLGYLLHRQGLWKNAIIAFQRATEITYGVEKDKMLCNLGYCLLKNSQPVEAIEAFHCVTEATFNSTVGLALAHFKAGQFEESYSVYESALEWLAKNDSEKSLILIAMSAMVYAFQSDKEAKTLIFQCIAQTPPHIESLFSACALGILHQDMQLSKLVLEELRKYESDYKHSHHVVFLMSQFYLVHDNVKKALQYILLKIHVYPNRPLLRKVLSDFLLKNYPTTEKYLFGASRIAQSTIILKNSDINCKNTSLDAAKSMAVASKAMCYVNRNVMKKLAQKAIHLHPTCKEAWASLILCE